RHRRDTESPLWCRTANPNDPDTGANQDESEEGADAGHFTDDIFWNECGENSGEDEKEYVRFVRRSKARMNIRKSLRDKAIATHGKEDARLTEQHHENDRGKTGQNRNRDRLREPFVAGHIIANGKGNRRLPSVCPKIIDRGDTV